MKVFSNRVILLYTQNLGKILLSIRDFYNLRSDKSLLYFNSNENSGDPEGSVVIRSSEYIIILFLCVSPFFLSVTNNFSLYLFLFILILLRNDVCQQTSTSRPIVIFFCWQKRCGNFIRRSRIFKVTM